MITSISKFLLVIIVGTILGRVCIILPMELISGQDVLEFSTAQHIIMSIALIYLSYNIIDKFYFDKEKNVDEEE